MDTITLPKKQYSALLEKALRYQYIASLLKSEASIFSPPPTKSIKEISKGFVSTKLYNKKFIETLEKGLKRSDYFKE